MFLQIKKILLFAKIKYVSLFLFIIIGYSLLYYGRRVPRNQYNMELNCVKVIRIIEHSSYKSQPSIIVELNNKEVEIIQYYSYKFDFKQFSVGDIICKEMNNFNFLKIGANGRKDTIIHTFYWKFINSLLLMPENPYDESKLKCNCL